VNYEVFVQCAHTVFGCDRGHLYLYSAATQAESRYQVVPLHPGYEFGTEKALVLDTVAGHMWIWVESLAVGKREGGRYVIY
jgi:hypothetical protein